MANYTPSTAFAIESLPYMRSVDLSASPDDPVNVPAHAENDPAKNPGWWTITAGSSDDAISAAATYDGFESGVVPLVAVWIDDPDNPGTLTQAITVGGENLNAVTVRNNPGAPLDGVIGWWLMFPAVLGQTYYFQVLDDGDPYVAPTANFTLHVRRSPRASVPIGSFMITDDSLPYPAVAMSSEGVILRVFDELDATEIGATLATGEVCLATNSDNDLTVYSTQMTSVATATPPDPVGSIQPGQGKWFFISFFGTLTLGTIDTAGVIGGTTWTLAEFFTFTSFAVSPDETIAYWADANGVIHRHDLINDVPLSDLAVVTPNAFGEMGCDVDGNVVVRYGATPETVRQYAPDGTLLQTYSVATADYTIDHMRVFPFGTYFGVWEQSDAADPLLGRWTAYQLSDGAVIAGPSTLPLFDTSGIGPVEAYPFGPSNSCPLLFVADPIPGPPAPFTTYPLRRERIFPLPFDQNNWMFPSRIEFIIQSGVGLSGGQGVAPVLLVQFSQDGGITWGTEFQVGMGPLGATQFRAYINRLSRYRNGAVKVACTDPVFFAMLDATIDLEKGTN